MKYQQKVATEAKKRRQRLLYARNNGLTVTEIASRQGISKQRVSALLKMARAE